jgi:hypothetical protein
LRDSDAIRRPLTSRLWDIAIRRHVAQSYPQRPGPSLFGCLSVTLCVFVFDPLIQNLACDDQNPRQQ